MEKRFGRIPEEANTVILGPVENRVTGIPGKEISDEDISAFVATMTRPENLSLEEEFEENFVDLCWEGVL